MSQGKKKSPLTFVLLAVVGLIGLTVVICCGGFSFMSYKGKQLQEEKRAKEAPYRKKLRGDWVAYAALKDKGGKKTKSPLKPVLGLKITDDTFRLVKSGADPKNHSYTLENLRKKSVKLHLGDITGDQQRVWEITFRKGELRVDIDGQTLAMRSEPKTLARLLRKQKNAWASEEKKLKEAKATTALEYCRVFAKDAERAKRVFNNRRLEISGTIADKEYNEDADVVLTLSEEDCPEGIWLYLHGRKGRDFGAPLRAGDTIRARCTSDDPFIDTPQLKACELLEVNDEKPQKSRRKPLKVTADKLCNDYKRDTDAADEKYVYRQLEISGEIKEITDGIFIGYQMTLETRQCVNDVFANFERDAAAKDARALGLGAGDTITASCFWDGRTLGVMHLSDCEPMSP